jgi:hypothetical protein
MTGFINDEEAAWYVQVAQGAHCRQKRACVADAAPAHNFPVPIPSKKLKTLDLSCKTHAFQWFTDLPVPLRRGQTHSQLIDSCWEIYLALGPRGEQWSPLLEGEKACAREASVRKMQLFEQKTVSGRVSCLRVLPLSCSSSTP